MLGVLLAGGLPAVHASGTDHPIAFERYHVAVDGQVADGWLAYPTDVTPVRLLVIAHGCCIATGGWAPSLLNTSYHMATYARAGVAVVAMDFRGAGHWDVWAGHRDTLAATRDLKARWPIERTVLWGVSMGGEVSGMAAAADPSLFDFWVDTFGVTDLAEEFAFLAPDEPQTGGPAFSMWISQEAGLAPDGWLQRSPALRASEMAGGRLRHAYLIHGAGDAVVPVSQSTEMFERLREAGVPATLLVVTTNQDACGHCGLQTPYQLGASEASKAPAGLAGHGRWVDPYTIWFLDSLLVAGTEPMQGDGALVGVLDGSVDNLVPKGVHDPLREGGHDEEYAPLPSGSADGTSEYPGMVQSFYGVP